MRKIFLLAVVMMCLGFSHPALADIFSFTLDGQVGYSRIQNIQTPGTDVGQTFSDMAIGARAKLQVLFICLMADYQHLILKNADYLHAGLGSYFDINLDVVKPYIRGSIGMMLFSARKGGFDDPKADGNLDASLGAEARVGLGLDIPLGKWFAVGVSFDFGYHYITSKWGYDLSAMGYGGLRI